MQGHFEKAGVPAKRIVKEFPVTPDAHVPVGMSAPFPCRFFSNQCTGTTLSAIHFVPGQFIDVVADSCVDKFHLQLSLTLLQHRKGLPGWYEAMGLPWSGR